MGRTKRTINGMIRRALRQIDVAEHRGSVYALVDAARDERLHPIITEGPQRWRCLYGDEVPRALAAVAPYIVAMPAEGPFSALFAREGRNRSWGVMIRSTAVLDDLTRHFYGLLRVAQPDGQELLFRYYDPRVLRVFLPTCTADQLARFFGPVEAFLVEQGEGEWRSYHVEAGQLDAREPRWDLWID